MAQNSGSYTLKTDENEIYSYLSNFPTELLLHIFTFLKGREVIKCRGVCSRWRIVIDGTTHADTFWEKYFKTDFKDVYYRSVRKARIDMLWFELYRCLCSWSIVNKALEVRDEFASASEMRKEIRSFEILSNGCIGVHTKGSIEYYDINTLEFYPRTPIYGDFSRYTETEDYLILMNSHLSMFIIRKHVESKALSCISFGNIKAYLMIKHQVYYVSLTDEMFVCNLQDMVMQSVFIKRLNDCIMCLGSTDDRLHLLTFQRNIYTLKENKLVFECSLGPNTNILHQLRKYNFLEQLDWRVYFQWMYVLNHTVPEGPLRDIVTIRAHGDVYFVGSNWGVLRIYYAPYPDGEFDIFNTDPIKQYNFMERYDCPVLSMCPILMIDVMERKDGHTLLIAMPKKIAVMKFNHDFETPEVNVVLEDEKFEQCRTSFDETKVISETSIEELLECLREIR